MRVAVWICVGICILAIVLWVTHTPSSRHTQKPITIKCDPNRYSVCR